MHSRPASRRGGGLVWMLLPFAAIFAAIVWLTGPRLRERMGAEQDARISTRTVAAGEDPMHQGFQAEHGRIGRVRLAPLHASGERQDFEARALGRLAGGIDGMPWRLRIVREDLAEPWVREPLDLGSLRVTDGDELWQPFPVDELEPDSPLAVLLAPAPADPGGPLDLILWGPRNSQAPVLEMGGMSVELTPSSWVARGEDEALIRLEPLR